MTNSTQPPEDDGRSRGLTERQQNILDFIHESMEGRAYPPSMREIADAVGLRSTSAVSYQLNLLAEMGYLARDANKARTVVEKPRRLRVIQEGNGSQNMVCVPLFERIAAGTPVMVNPDSEDIMQLPREMVGSGDLFAVRVVGDSMVNANIFDGDCVVVRQQQVADDGDIVAARIDDEATVKTFQRANGHVWLMPQNPAYEPILGDRCRLMGKVVATVHRM